MVELSAGTIVAIDGKTMRGALMEKIKNHLFI